jgi:hypothetical protein
MAYRDRATCGEIDSDRLHGLKKVLVKYLKDKNIFDFAVLFYVAVGLIV